MSKNSNHNQPKPIKNIEVGKFYFIHDKSKVGHPGFIIKKDDEKNRYLVVRFDSDKDGEIPKMDRGIRHITKLKHPTDNIVKTSYVHNRPMLCKRKDIGRLMLNMSVHHDDYKIIEEVSKNPPELSGSFKKKK